MIERKHIAELWNRLAAIYGHRWSSGHGESDADDTWFHGLHLLEPASFAVGLRACMAMSASRVRTGDDDWPPTLGEFRAMCLSHGVAYHQPYKALPFKPASLTPDEQQEVTEMLRLAAAGELDVLEAYITDPKAKRILQLAKELDASVRRRFGDKYAEELRGKRIDLGALARSGISLLQENA